MAARVAAAVRECACARCPPLPWPVSAWRHGHVELAADLRECWTADAVSCGEPLHGLRPDRLVQLVALQDHDLSAHVWIEAQPAPPHVACPCSMFRMTSSAGQVLPWSEWWSRSTPGHRWWRPSSAPRWTSGGHSPTTEP